MPKLPSNKFTSAYFGLLILAAIMLAVAIGGYTHDKNMGMGSLFGIIGIGTVVFMIRFLLFQNSDSSDDT